MAPPFTSLPEASAWYGAWLREAALPLWARAGVTADGAFEEALTLDGRPVGGRRRARVQARQAYVYATAAQAGFGRDWLDLAVRGFAEYVRQHRQPNGLFAAAVDADGAVTDPACGLYEQDFSLLALSALHTAGQGGAAAMAAEVLARLQPYRHAAGGFRELGPHPFQSNAHMHLLESAMAWEAAGGGPEWAALADEIVALALARFIDAGGGFLREFFDAGWLPAPGDDGRWVEPGHQFEWAWLLERWGRARGDRRARDAARRLFACGLPGVDAAREVAIDVLWDDLSPRERRARLWPQTEYLKAALILGEDAHALTACRGLARYLDTPARGAWRDKMTADGGFADEPAPASSFYHIVVALLALFAAAG